MADDRNSIQSLEIYIGYTEYSSTIYFVNNLKIIQSKMKLLKFC